MPYRTQKTSAEKCQYLLVKKTHDIAQEMLTNKECKTVKEFYKTYQRFRVEISFTKPTRHQVTAIP